MILCFDYQIKIKSFLRNKFLYFLNTFLNKFYLILKNNLKKKIRLIQYLKNQKLVTNLNFQNNFINFNSFVIRYYNKILEKKNIFIRYNSLSFILFYFNFFFIKNVYLLYFYKYFNVVNKSINLVLFNLEYININNKIKYSNKFINNLTFFDYRLNCIVKIPYIYYIDLFNFYEKIDIYFLISIIKKNIIQYSLPTNIKKFIFLKSPHVHKKAREHLEIRSHSFSFLIKNFMLDISLKDFFPISITNCGIFYKKKQNDFKIF